MPQTAVLLGMMRKRLIAQPMATLAATESATTPRKIGQLCMKPTTIAGVMEWAMRQPMIACAAAIRVRGIFTVPPAVCASTAATSGPSMKAAGNLTH